MAPAPPHVITSSNQAWRLIEKDYTLRLSLVAPKFAEEHQQAKNELFAEARKRGNSAYLGPAWVDMEIADTNKRADWAYKACCEVWEIQGRVKCRAFFRAVFDWCLQPIFATRKGCFTGELNLYETRTRRTLPQGTAILGHMTHQMGHLICEWNTKLEIDARDNEYQQQLAREREYKDKKEREREAQAIRATAPSSPQVSLVAISSRREVKHKAIALTVYEKQRRKVIFGAIQARDKGPKYCKTLDGRKLAIPAEWIQDGCPNTYADAYKRGQPWRKRIQDEKSRYKKKYDETSAAESEKLLQ